MRVSFYRHFLLTTICCVIISQGDASADRRLVPNDFPTIADALVGATSSTVIKVAFNHVEKNPLIIDVTGVTIEGVTPYRPLKRRIRRNPDLLRRGGRPTNFTDLAPIRRRTPRKPPLAKVKAAPTWMPQILPSESGNHSAVKITAHGVTLKNFAVGEYGKWNSINGVFIGGNDVEVENLHCLGPFRNAANSQVGAGIATRLHTRNTNIKECSVVNASLMGIELRSIKSTISDTWVMCDSATDGTDYYFVVWDKPNTTEPVMETRDSDCTLVNCAAARILSPEGTWSKHQGHGFTLQGVESGRPDDVSVAKNNKIIDCDAYDVGDAVLLRGFRCCGNEIRNFLSISGQDADHSRENNDGRDGLILIEGGAYGNFIRGYRGINNTVAIEFVNRPRFTQDPVGSNNVFYECTWTDIRSRAIDHNQRHDGDGSSGKVASTFIASSTFTAKHGEEVPFFVSDRDGVGNSMFYCNISGFARMIDSELINPTPETIPGLIERIDWGLFNNNIDGVSITNGW